MWKLVKDLTPYIQSEDVAPDEERKYALVERYFSKDDSEYPLIYIAIYPDLAVIRKEPIKGIKVGVAWKSKQGEWWSDYGAYVPIELIDTLKEMIEEAKTKISQQ